MNTVFLANHDYPGALGSLGTGSYILITQYNFPHKYSGDKDTLITQDHDHINNNDRDMLQRECNEAYGSGELGIGQFARDANPQKVLRFLKTVLKADKVISWTGFRVMQTTHKGNGFPVFTLELFSNESECDVYTGLSGPNINKPSKQNKSSFGYDYE